MKTILVLLVLFSLTLSAALAYYRGKCPKTEQVVWASDGSTCRVFRNQCFLDEINVNRRWPFTIKTKSECQSRCPKICPQVLKPKSGEYKGNQKMFNNECEMLAYCCRTGETYI